MSSKIKTILAAFLTVLLFLTNSGILYLRPFKGNQAQAIEVQNSCYETQGAPLEECGVAKRTWEGNTVYCQYAQPECVQQQGEYEWDCNLQKERRPCWGAACTEGGWNKTGCQASGQGENLDVDLCSLPAQILQGTLGVGMSALTNEAFKSLLGPKVAKNFKVVVDFMVWAENRGYTLQQLMNMDRSTLVSLIEDFVDSGVSALEEYAMSEIKKVIIQVMVEMKIDPGLAKQIGNFLEYLVRVKDYNISLIISISPDEFLNLLTGYIEYSQAPILKEVLKLKVMVESLSDLNLSQQQVQQFLSFVNWLIEAKDYSLQEILALSHNRIQQLINEFESEMGITLTFSAQRLRSLIQEFLNDVIDKIGFDQKLIAQSVRFINFLVNVKNLNLQAILELEIMQLKNHFAEFTQQAPQILQEILINVLRPTVEVMIGVEIPPWLLVQIADFVQFLQQTKGFNLQVIVDFSINQLEEYLEEFISAQISQLTGMRISDIQMIITLITERGLLDDIASLDVQAIFNQFVQINISGSFNCPYEPISAGCRAINSGNWRDPILTGDLIVHPDQNKEDKKIKVTDTSKMLRWAQFSPCNVPNFNIEFLGRTIFGGLNFRFPPLEVYGNKLWVDMPTVCATNFKAGQWFRTTPEISHSYFTKKPGSERNLSFLYDHSGRKQLLSICKVPVVGFDSILRAGIRKTIRVGQGDSSKYEVEGDNLERIVKKKNCPPFNLGCFLLDVKPKKHERVYVKEMPTSGYVDYMMYWKPKKNWETCRQPMMAGYWLKKEKKDGTIEVIDGAGKENFSRTVKDFRQAMEEVSTFTDGKAWFEKGEKVVVDLWGCLDSGFRIQYNTEGAEQQPTGDLSCKSSNNNSITLNYEFSEGSKVSLFRNDKLLNTFSGSSDSDTYSDSELSSDTSYDYYLRNGKESASDLLSSVTCSTEQQTGCNCSGWSNQSCGQGDCSSNQIQQVRSCESADCEQERCISDTCESWSDRSCGQGDCAREEMRQTRSCKYGCKTESRCVQDPSCETQAQPSCSDVTINQQDNKLPVTIQAEGDNINEIKAKVYKKSCTLWLFCSKDLVWESNWTAGNQIQWNGITDQGEAAEKGNYVAEVQVKNSVGSAQCEQKGKFKVEQVSQDQPGSCSISSDKNKVQPGEEFTITVDGQDRDGLTGIYYKEQENWIEEPCSQNKSCEVSWTISKPAGTYNYQGKITDSNENTYQCDNTVTVKVQQQCVPKTCSELNKECGTWNDGCGGSVNCETCSGKEVSCGYRDCSSDEKPSWFCDNNGQCQYNCNYDQSCVTGPDCQADHTDSQDGKCEQECDASSQCDERTPNSSWTSNNDNTCNWCNSSCQYDSGTGKPLTYYSSENTCYYDCSIKCGVGGWKRKNCKDSSKPCNQAQCTANGWDDSSCEVSPSCNGYSYSPAQVAPGEPSFYGCAPITFKAQGNPSETRVVVWRTSSTVNNSGTYTCDGNKSWYDGPLCWGGGECRCWDSGYVEGDTVTWDGNCTLGGGRPKAEGQKLLYAVWSKCSSGSELCKSLQVNRFIKPGWSGKKTATGPSHNDWDWNCDGQVEKKWTKVGECSCDKSTFTGTTGWTAPRLWCGGQRKWITGTGCHKEGIWPVTWWACNKETRRQQCR